MYACIKIPAILSAVSGGRCGGGIKLREEGQGTEYERGHAWLEWVGLGFCYVSSVISCVTKLTNGLIDA